MKLAKYALKQLQKLRIYIYRGNSNAKIKGKPNIQQPTLYSGAEGLIKFGPNVNFGFLDSPGFFSGYNLLSVRSKQSTISFGGNNHINNNFTAISEGPGIFIGENTIIGYSVQIYDTDFHTINIKRLGTRDYPKSTVVIGNNVWIGNNCILLKGCSVGDNSVIAAGSIVTKKFGENLIIGGTPARILKKIPAISD